MTRNPTSGFWDFAVQFLLGGVVLVLVTLAFYSLRVDLASTAFAYLVVILLISLMGSFAASALLSILSVGEPDLLLCSAVPRVQNRRAATSHSGTHLPHYLGDCDPPDPNCPEGEGHRPPGRSEGPAERGLLARAQELSKTGSFGYNVSTGENPLVEETFRIFQCDPATKPTWSLCFTASIRMIA